MSFCVSRATVLGPRGSTRDGCCSHPPVAYRYPSLSSIQIPAFSLPNHLSPFACLHLPAHCYSLLLATPFSGSLYYVYAVCFPFLYLCYPLQAPPSRTTSISLCDDCTDAFIGDWVLLHCTVCHFATSLLFPEINYPSNKTINSKSGSVLAFVSNCGKLFKVTQTGNQNPGGSKGTVQS